MGNTLDTAYNIYELRLKESLHIEWEKPNLNKQFIHTILTLMF